MNQQEMEQELSALKARLGNEIDRLTGTCDELSSQLAALRKRVRQIEADYYKDQEVPLKSDA
jgi:DNA-directed RNA polymerase sigma subunit (sigma70/sigma32)